MSDLDVYRQQGFGNRSGLGHSAALLIVDCITVWVGNELHHRGEVDVSEVATALSERSGPSVVITNEVGLGVVPATPAGRLFRDLLGGLNQRVGATADRLYLVVAGRALDISAATLI